MESELQRKIEETVLDILRNADIDQMTEFKVRQTASERLSIELSDIQHKTFIRGVVEAFLLTTMEANGEEGKEADANLREENQAMAPVEHEALTKKEFDSDGNPIICKLSNRRNVVIQEFKGKSFVSIREFYYKDGRQLASSKGISMPAEQWSVFRKNVPLIEDAVLKMQSKLRSELHEDKSNDQISNVVVAASANKICGQVPGVVTTSTNELNGHASNFATASASSELNGQISKSVNTSQHELNGQVSNSAIAASVHDSSSRELFPVEINRFDGKNYQYWATQMELFLKQLNIAYVLTNPCPSSGIRPEASAEDIAQSKADQLKWLSDDYMCRRHILSSLSDALYNKYSKKASNAKEIWEELKFIYLYEECGRKRSHVKKYIEFQIVDENSVADQVQELNTIADSIVATGIFVDEKFHVSAIISKLPPSWRDFCIKLLGEENLPFWMLMDRVRAEEDSRNRAEPSNSAFFNHAKNLVGPRMKDMKKPGFIGRKRDIEMDNKGYVCYSCGKKGHISKHCRSKKFDKDANDKLDTENSSTAPAVSEGRTEQC